MTMTPTSPALPFPVLPDASVESCIVALVAALVQSKGWMHGHADAIVRDAVDRVHLGGTCERSLSVVAWLYTHKISGASAASDWRWPATHAAREFHVETHLVRLTDAQSALLAQAAGKDAELQRLRADAERYRWLRDVSEWEMFEDRWLTKNDIYGQGPADLDAAIDASRALAQKEKT